MNLESSALTCMTGCGYFLKDTPLSFKDSGHRENKLASLSTCFVWQKLCSLFHNSVLKFSIYGMIYLILYKEHISLPNLKLNVCDVGLNSLDFFLVCLRRHFHFIYKVISKVSFLEDCFYIIYAVDLKKYLLEFEKKHGRMLLMKRRVTYCLFQLA